LWAGGCVRDRLLGREPKDYDVATDATPEQIRDLFGRRRTFAVGAAFGVVTVVGGKGAGQLDVVTFRRDADYSDGRHPDAVTFSTSPEEDAQRRDFTINGLYYDPLEDRVIDYVGGVEDLQRRVVRAIGEPHARFAEDKLRMLRAVRFAATYELCLDSDTLAAIRAMASQILVVSAERIAQEIRAMLVHPRRSDALRMLLDAGLLAHVLPEVLALRGMPRPTAHHRELDCWGRTLLVMDQLHEPSFALALAALLHELGNAVAGSAPGSEPELREGEAVAARRASEVCRRWRLSRSDEDRVTWLVQNHMVLNDARAMRWSRLQRILVSPGIADLVDLHEAIAKAASGDTSEIDYCRRMLEQPHEQLNLRPLISGDDLIRHGVPPGERYKRLLDAVRDAQLEGAIGTKREALALVDQLLADPPPGPQEPCTPSPDS